MKDNNLNVMNSITEESQHNKIKINDEMEKKELIVIISKVKYTVPGTLGIRMEIKRAWVYIKRIKRNLSGIIGTTMVKNHLKK